MYAHTHTRRRREGREKETDGKDLTGHDEMLTADNISCQSNSLQVYITLTIKRSLDFFKDFKLLFSFWPWSNPCCPSYLSLQTMLTLCLWLPATGRGLSRSTAEFCSVKLRLEFLFHHPEKIMEQKASIARHFWNIYIYRRKKLHST